MKLIVGLGNPGEKYKKTRHNLGFTVIERFFKDYEVSSKTIWNNEAKFKSEVTKLDWKPKIGKLEQVILAKPKTYMNNSGMAVSLLVNYFKIKPEDVWIIHDDIDLPLGAMKIRFGGASAGNKGVESIIDVLKTDKFWRFRLGIGHPGKIQNSELGIKNGIKLRNLKPHKDVDDYVLGSFSGSEWGKAKDLIKRSSKALQMGLEEGLPAAMNRFNTK